MRIEYDTRVDGGIKYRCGEGVTGWCHFVSLAPPLRQTQYSAEPRVGQR